MLNAVVALACIGMAAPYLADTAEQAAPAIELGEQLEAAEYIHHYCRLSLPLGRRFWLCLVPGAGGAAGL